jgi:hypothetical protein
MKTKTFKVEIDGVEKEYLVRSPSLDNQREAQKVYNQAFTDAIKSKSVVRAKLDDLLEDQGLWNDEKQAKFTELQRELLEGEKRLAKGGFSLNEAKDLAIKMKSVRDEIRELISVRTSLDNHSAEGQADNSRFNYLVSVCLVYNDTKQPVYKNMEEYLNSSTDKVAIMGAQHLANMLYGLDNDYESNLPENKFLKKFKFVDDKLRLVDKKGRLIDREGRLIDETGRFLDESGNFVDKFGNQVDKDGEYLVDSEPFLDENGKPIILDEDTPKNDKVEPSVVQETTAEVISETSEVSTPTEQTVST